jgi:hypothetical protein
MNATIVYGSKCCLNCGALPTSLFCDGLGALSNRDPFPMVDPRSVDLIEDGFMFVLDELRF